VPPKRDPLGIVSGGWYAQNLRPFQRRFGDRLLILWYDDVQRDPAAVYRAALVHLGVDAEFVPPEVERVRYSTRDKVEHHPLSPEDRVALWPLFARDVAKLERRTGRDLSAWRPSPVAATGGRR
jgi:hypothetical protein